MDVLYYWKNIDDDLKHGRIGRFISDKQKLDVLKEGFPDFIWAIKTPVGRLGEVQLLAKLAWSDTAPKGIKPVRGESAIYYDPLFPRSGRFDKAVSEANIERTSKWIRLYFPAAVKANFQGQNGQLELRGEPLRALKDIASTWSLEPLVPVE